MIISKIDYLISIEIKNDIDLSTIALLQCNGWSTTGRNGCQLIKIGLDKFASSEAMEQA